MTLFRVGKARNDRDGCRHLARRDFSAARSRWTKPVLGHPELWRPIVEAVAGTLFVTSWSVRYPVSRDLRFSATGSSVWSEARHSGVAIGRSQAVLPRFIAELVISPDSFEGPEYLAERANHAAGLGDHKCGEIQSSYPSRHKSLDLRDIVISLRGPRLTHRKPTSSINSLVTRW